MSLLKARTQTSPNAYLPFIHACKSYVTQAPSDRAAWKPPGIMGGACILNFFPDDPSDDDKADLIYRAVVWPYRAFAIGYSIMIEHPLRKGFYHNYIRSQFRHLEKFATRNDLSDRRDTYHMILEEAFIASGLWNAIFHIVKVPIDAYDRATTQQKAELEKRGAQLFKNLEQWRSINADPWLELWLEVLPMPNQKSIRWSLFRKAFLTAIWHKIDIKIEEAYSEAMIRRDVRDRLGLMIKAMDTDIAASIARNI